MPLTSRSTEYADNHRWSCPGPYRRFTWSSPTALDHTPRKRDQCITNRPGWELVEDSDSVIGACLRHLSSLCERRIGPESVDNVLQRLIGAEVALEHAHDADGTRLAASANEARRGTLLRARSVPAAIFTPASR